MALNAYACKPAMMALDKAKRAPANAKPDTEHRRWTSSAGWLPGLAGPLVNAGELTEPVVLAGYACITRQRRHAACMWEYAQALEAFCRIGLGFTRENGGLTAHMAGLHNSILASADDTGNTALREKAVTAASTMTRYVNHLRANLERSARDAGADAAESVRIVNLHLDAVAQWNRAVSLHMKSQPEAPPEQALADRLQHRESVVDELYRHIDIDLDEKRSGSLIISMHGANLVYFDRKAEYAPGHANLSPNAGRLAAQIEARDVLFPKSNDTIAVWVKSFASLFNHVYTPGGTGRESESAPPENDMFLVNATSGLLVNPAMVDNPALFQPPAGRRAVLVLGETLPVPWVDQLFAEKMVCLDRERALSGDILERVAWQQRMIAAGCGEKETAALVQCHRAFIDAYHQSDRAERAYRKLVEEGV